VEKHKWVDSDGRARAFEALVKGSEIPTPTVPESFKVLVKELQALTIDVVPVGVITATPQQEENGEPAKGQDESAKEGDASSQEKNEAGTLDDQQNTPAESTVEAKEAGNGQKEEESQQGA
jgi:DNA-directed RNA polymerase subunit beta